MKTLQESYIYQQLNRGYNVSKKITDTLVNGKVVTAEAMVTPLTTLERNIRLKDREAIVAMIKSGKIKVVMSPEGSKMPSSIPWIVAQGPNGAKTGYVFGDVYGRIEKRTGYLDVIPMKLYTQLLGVYKAMLMYEHGNWAINNRGFVNAGMTIYANLFVKVLNKKYSLNTNTVKLNRILFLSAKFFLVNHIGMSATSVTTDNYAKAILKSPNFMDIDAINDEMGPEAYENLNSFITGLMSIGSIEMTLPGLSLSSFLERYMTMYDGAMLLSLENLGYFCYNISGVVLSSYINSQFALEDICEKEGVKMHVALSNLTNRG